MKQGEGGGSWTICAPPPCITPCSRCKRPPSAVKYNYNKEQDPFLWEKGSKEKNYSVEKKRD